MKRSTAAALFAILLLAVLLRLLPLLRFLYWGSDFGEYFALTRAVAQDGVLPRAYAGWGATYPSFPGFFVVNGAFAVLGIPAEAVLSFLVPIVAAFGVLPMFLLAVRVTGDDFAGLVAAAFLAASFFHAFPTSHAIPASLGDLLLLGALVMFLGLRRTPALLAPLALTGAAIVVTHHLTTYVLLVAAASALALRALLDRKLTIRAIRRELAFLALLVAATLAFWALYATPFWTLIATLPPSSPLLLVAGGAIAVAAAPLVILVRRRTSWRFRPRLRSLRAATVASGVAFATAVGIVGLASVAPVPGTAIRIDLAAMLPFLPLFAFLSLSAAGRKFLDVSREGVDATAWFLGILASIVVGFVAAPQVLIPYRHLEYLAVPLAVMIGMGLRWLSLGGHRRAIAAGAAAVLLVAGTAATAFPPPSTLAGFQEGISPRTVEAALWVRDHASGLVAGDHRESTVLFGFGGVDATWDRQTAFWHMTNVTAALTAMRSVPFPNGTTERVAWVLIDADLLAGLQTTPFDPALPLRPGEAAKFAAPPFMKMLDTGYAQVYYVNWGLA